MPNPKPALIFTLVHGTFAQGTDWVTDDSSPTLFRSRLRAALEPQFDVTFDDTFDWGYRSYRRPWDNTLAARRAGAAKLARHLTNLPDAGEARRYLVAHSHGGNVALHALKDEEARKKVDGLICLATPCLFSKAAPLRRDLLGFSAVVLLLATLGWQSRLPWAWSAALWTYTIIYLLMFLLIVTVRQRDSAKVQSHVKEFEVPDVPQGPPVWFLRVREDEVGLLMNFSYRVGRAVRRSWEFVNRIGGWILGAYFVSIIPARIASGQLGLDWPWLNQATTVVDRIMTPIMILATAILMAMVVLRLSFAFDSIRWVPDVDTWSEPVQWKGAKVDLVSLDPRTRGLLRHTKIHGPATVRIAEVVRSRFTGAGVAG